MLKLNVNRLKALLIREFHFGFKPNILLLSVVISAIFLVHLTSRIINPGDSGGIKEVSITLIKFGLILMIWGFIYASNAFREFKKVSTRAQYLSLPSSSLEKLIVKWVYTNPIFILSVSILVFILASILMPYMDSLVGRDYVNEVFTSRLYWNLVGIYFIVHSIFFFGSIAFNKRTMVKTILSLIIIALVIVLLNGIFFRIVWANIFDGLFHIEAMNGRLEFGVNHDNPKDLWQVKFFVFAFKYLLAPVIWVASLFKLSEKEI